MLEIDAFGNLGIPFGLLHAAILPIQRLIRKRYDG